MRIVDLMDVQVDRNVDGYVYCFTSVADGPVLSQMALKQILVLLHVIFSYIPEECILETEYLKPTFDKSSFSSSHGGGGGGAGLEKLQKKVPMTEEEVRRARELQAKLSSMQLCDMPFNEAFVATTDDKDDDHFTRMSAQDYDDEASAFQRIQRSMLAGRRHTLQIVDVADILVVPVCITHAVAGAAAEGEEEEEAEWEEARQKKKRKKRPDAGADALDDEDDDDDDDEREKITGFWMVMLKTRKCYNFAVHLHWLVSAVDKKVG